MNILFLDDDRNRWNAINEIFEHFKDIIINWAQTVDEAIQFLKEFKYDIIMLDHDLGGKIYQPSGPETGYEVAQWISKNLKEIPIIYIHTMNSVGAANMKSLLPTANIVPFHILLQQLKLI